MIFIFGPYAAGKREYVRKVLGYPAEAFAQATCSGGPVVYDIHHMLAQQPDLGLLAEQLSRKEIVIATEMGCGVVPIDAEERALREAAGRLNCLLAQRAQRVIRIWYGIAETLK